VWETEKINLEDETEYLRIFSSTVERLFKAENPALISKLLNDFDSFAKNRSILSLLRSDEIFPEILEWSHKAWQFEVAFVKWCNFQSP
jgi:hypothetical protein